MTRRLLLGGIACLAGMCLLGEASPALASWGPDGNPLCTDPAQQQGVRAAPDGNGGYYAIWNDLRHGPSSVIYAQHVDAEGNVAAGNWGAQGLQITSIGAATGEPNVISDGASGAYLFWLEVDYVAMPPVETPRVLRVDTFGSPASGWPAGGVILTSLGEFNRHFELIEDGSGGVIVVWWHQLEPYFHKIRGQRLSPAANLMWGSGGAQFASVSAAPVALEGQAYGRLVSDQVGSPHGAFFAWETSDSTGERGVSLLRFTSSGTTVPGWPANGMTVDLAGSLQMKPSVLADGSGGGLFLWEDRRGGVTDPQLYAVRLQGDGSPVPGGSSTGQIILGLPGSKNADPHLVPAGAGTGIVVYATGSGPPSALRAAKVDANGAPVWFSPLFPSSTPLSETFALRVAPDGSLDGALVVWSQGPFPKDIWGHSVRGGNLGLPGNGAPLCQAVQDQGLVDLVPAGLGRAIAIFTDHRDGNLVDVDLYAQRLQGFSNLNTYMIVPGWSFPIVPQENAEAIPGDVPLPGTLPGNTSTYLNWSFFQEGPHALPAVQTRVLLDDVPVASAGFPDPVSVGSFEVLNQGPVSVRGGRHCLESQIDFDDQAAEADENDNVWATQFVWSPLELRKATATSRAVPPSPCFHIQPSGDGFSFTRDPSYAWVIALAPRNSGDDYDLYVYDDYSSSTSGFSNLRDFSFYVDNFTEFVVGHYAGTPATLYPAAVLYATSGGGGDFVADWTDAENHNATDTGDFPDQHLAADRLADVYEAYLTAGMTYTFVLTRTAGPTNVTFSIFPGTAGGIHDRSSPAAFANPLGEFNSLLIYEAVVTGWHPIVVYRRTGVPAIESAASGIVYDLSWQPGVVGVPEHPDTPPVSLRFLGAHPNPVRGSTWFAMDLPRPGDVRLELFDVSGRRVRRLVDEALGSGTYRLPWDGTAEDGSPVAAGVYYARLWVAGEVLAQRVTVLR